MTEKLRNSYLDKATYNRSSNESQKVGVTFCDRELRHTMIRLNGKKKKKRILIIEQKEKLGSFPG